MVTSDAFPLASHLTGARAEVMFRGLLADGASGFVVKSGDLVGLPRYLEELLVTVPPSRGQPTVGGRLLG